jgi:hypothetical protein
VFSRAILLRCVGRCEFPLDAFFVQPLHERVRGVFSTTIAAKAFEKVPSFSF